MNLSEIEAELIACGEKGSYALYAHFHVSLKLTTNNEVEVVMMVPDGTVVKDNDFIEDESKRLMNWLVTMNKPI